MTERVLTVGELKAALANVPDDQRVSFLTGEEGARLVFKDLEVEPDGADWLVMFNLTVNSPLIEGGQELAYLIQALRSRARGVADTCEEFEALSAEVLTCLEDFREERR